MREIQFRGQRVSEPNEWVYGYFVKGTDGGYYITSGDPKDDMFDTYEVIPETVSQFTGLKDKNEKEIYEGDIIQYDDVKESFSVIFKRGAFGYLVDWLMSFVPLAHMNEIKGDGKVSWIVIGNIHEKPELLERGE